MAKLPQKMLLLLLVGEKQPNSNVGDILTL